MKEVRNGGGRGHPRATHIVGCNILDCVFHSVIHYHHSHSSPCHIAFPYTCHVDVPAGAPPVILQDRQDQEVCQGLGNPGTDIAQLTAMHSKASGLFLLVAASKEPIGPDGSKVREGQVRALPQPRSTRKGGSIQGR